MDLVVDQVAQLQDVALADRDGLTELLACTAIVEPRLTGAGKLRHELETSKIAVLFLVHVHEVAVRLLDNVRDLLLGSAVEYRRCNVHRTSYDLVGLFCVRPAPLRRPTKVAFEQLANVHTRRNAQRIQDDVDRSTVCKIRHVLDWQDARDNTLVTMTTRKLVALLDLTLLSNEHAHELVDTWC